MQTVSCRAYSWRMGDRPGVPCEVSDSWVAALPAELPAQAPGVRVVSRDPIKNIGKASVQTAKSSPVPCPYHARGAAASEFTLIRHPLHALSARQGSCARSRHGPCPRSTTYLQSANICAGCVQPLLLTALPGFDNCPVELLTVI